MNPIQHIVTALLAFTAFGVVLAACQAGQEFTNRPPVVLFARANHLYVVETPTPDSFERLRMAAKPVAEEIVDVVPATMIEADPVPAEQPAVGQVEKVFPIKRAKGPKRASGHREVSLADFARMLDAAKVEPKQEHKAATPSAPMAVSESAIAGRP